MKKCKNCDAITREEDIYCRNCGVLIISDAKMLVYSIFNGLIIIGIILLIILLIVSYLVD